MEAMGGTLGSDNTGGYGLPLIMAMVRMLIEY
jgi:hypothetical protein